jgi:P-type Ca2+ transporter type 2C
MDRPPRDPKNLIVSNKDWGAIGLYSLAITIACMAAVIFCKEFLLADDKTANNVAFVTLAFAQLFHVFNMASAQSKLLVNEITKNKFIWLAILICAGLIAIVFAVPQMRTVLGLNLLGADIWITAIVAGLIPLVLVQLFKILFRKK